MASKRLRFCVENRALPFNLYPSRWAININSIPRTFYGNTPEGAVDAAMRFRHPTKPKGAKRG